MSEAPIIQEYPPQDGQQYECCCARCGSSCDWVYCFECVWDEDDDCDYCGCGGRGGWWECLSSTDWCLANPLVGREDIERGQIEWYLDPIAQEQASDGEGT